MTLVLSLFIPSAFGQVAESEISVQINTPTPNLVASAVSTDQIDVTWDWDFVSVGFVPPSIIEMQIEYSTDGINFTGLQTHPPADFISSFTPLATGTYTFRVTVIDGNNFSYLLGPVPLSTGGRSGSNTPPSYNTTDVTLEGLAYPGPTTIVIFTYDGGFQDTITPDSQGNFSYQTSQLPVGSGTLSFSAQDPLGTLSVPVNIPYSIPSNTPVVVSDVNMPPTLGLGSSVAVVGELLAVLGYGYGDGAISLTLDGPTPVAFLYSSAADGAYLEDIDTSSLDPGTYTVTVTATSSDSSVTSPPSEQLTFELLPSSPSPAICGDGALELPEECDDGNTDDGDGCSAGCLIEFAICGDAVLSVPEECDDGNTDDGDGCSSSCQLELTLPETVVNQPSPSRYASTTVDLSYSVLAEPNGSVDTIELYYSLNGASYVRYPTIFSAGTIQLNGLVDGDYEVYSLGRDAAGFLELVPNVPDVLFTVDAVEDFDVIAHPEKRVPAIDNWNLPGRLSLYTPGASASAYSWDFETDQYGSYTVELTNPVNPASYNAVFKGISHLTKRLDSVDFSNLEGLVLDFTLGSTYQLVAGDVHVSKDDFVNGLDISALVSVLYNSDQNGDLNWDSVVNALDISVLIGNLYKSGDGI